MKALLEHLKKRTIPHDLVDFLHQSNVEFYDGRLIVQVVDHKSAAPTQESVRTNLSSVKTIPFSVHNHNPCLTPSSWVPYTADIDQPGQGQEKSPPREGVTDDANAEKSAEQKDKENMPAPSFPSNGQRKSGTQPKKPKVYTFVLHPTPLSDYAFLPLKVADHKAANVIDGPSSAVVPATPIPSTPQTAIGPPAKKIKKSKLDLEISTHHAFAARTLLHETASLLLEPVDNVVDAISLLEALAHPMHQEKPPLPKTRKRTVAEMAADEEYAAAQEQYMLINDENHQAKAQGANGDVDGQVGGGLWEPRFERFKTLANIQAQHEEKRISEKARQQEADRKSMQERERERLRQENEKKHENERLRNAQLQQANTQHIRAQQDARQRAMAQQQPGMQGVHQVQHAHPQANGHLANGIQGPPQRFHQQVSQGPISSPIVRNGTPQNHSSPMNNAMQQSTSSMGGSPPRPGSVVNQQVGGPTSHGMTAQRSQQSHAGTPRMVSATPNVQSTPLNRQMSATPRMSQASPLQGQMSQVPHMPHIPQQILNNGQPMNLSQPQLQQLQLQQHQVMLQQRAQRQRDQAANIQHNMQMNGGQPLTQQQLMQAQLMRATQQQAQAQAQAQVQGGNMPQLAQNYQAQIAAMAQQTGNMPQNMQFNSQGMNPMAMQQVLHNQRVLQAQANAQAQQAHNQQQQPQMNMMTPQQQQSQMLARSVQNAAQTMYQAQFPALQAQYPNGVVPHEVMAQFSQQCKARAHQAVHEKFKAQAQMRQQIQHQQQQQLMAQQQQGMSPGLNQMNQMNGMGMQRPNGM